MLLRRLVSWKSYFYGVLVPLLRRIPPDRAQRRLRQLGQLGYQLIPSYRRRINRAADEARMWLGGHWDVRDLRCGLAMNQPYLRARDLLVAHLPDDQFEARFVVRGLDQLDGAAGQGRSVVLLTNHAGPFLLPIHYLLRRNYPLRLLVQRPTHVSAFLREHFDQDGPTGQRSLLLSRSMDAAEAAAQTMRALGVLRSGMILGVAGDVPWGGRNHCPADFLGRRRTFLAVWVTLAAVSGAPVIPVFCHSDRRGRFCIEFDQPVPIPQRSLGPPVIESIVQSYLARLQRWVSLHPCEALDYFLWKPTSSIIRPTDQPLAAVA